MFQHGHHGRGSFESRYRCYSVACVDKPHLENGDKVILPPSALDRLSSLNIDYPMLFEISNETTGRKSHCGVLEFIAEEGVVYMPHWMQQNLLLQEGDIVRLKSVSLSKGSYVKLRPHTKDFLDISNPKAVLETTLRNYTCMTVGDSFMVNYNNKKYYIDVLEAKPTDKICLIDTDCEVDFAPPLDYEEPPSDSTNASAPAPTASVPPSLFGRPPAKEKDAPPAEPEAPKFTAFAGAARRLDGKAAVAGSSLSAASSGSAAAASSSSSSGGGGGGEPKDGEVAGKMVFGGAAARKPGEPLVKKLVKKKKEKKEEDKPPEPKFIPFQGSGNKLK